ncbi:hypothetical protein BV25DRAFT_1431694 [Artomyces pyxidatus]|uniref:Uncharacterized protein n=1 Tax=Artomyces pyxidatus TaxID=48021 RepID=A0ACB8SLM6_9AGAM|nr:hypothetical protein BV25DRAFT_1431694 [Artomyces pyxidatus]
MHWRSRLLKSSTGCVDNLRRKPWQWAANIQLDSGGLPYCGIHLCWMAIVCIRLRSQWPKSWNGATDLAAVKLRQLARRPITRSRKPWVSKVKVGFREHENAIEMLYGDVHGLANFNRSNESRRY